ncbi:MAG: YunG family protein [Hyphomicrobiaceae bacterium]
MAIPFDEARVRAALSNAWSLDTAVQWTAENPASGQCNVTAAVVFDLFGGEIQRTRLPDAWHYYNRIDGVRMDLTDSQFSAPGAIHEAPDGYQDEITNRATALANIPDREYEALRTALLHELGPSSS